MVLGVCVECMLCLIIWVGFYVLVGIVLLLFIVLMLGVLVVIVGCCEVVLCFFVCVDGWCDEVVLFVVCVIGVYCVFKFGGVQVIVVMVYGMGSVFKCEKLFGLGNVWVIEVKLQVLGDLDGVVIDMLVGLFEVLVIVDDGVWLVFVVVDLLLQVEYGEDLQVVLLSFLVVLFDVVVVEVEWQVVMLLCSEIVFKVLVQSCLIVVELLVQVVEVSNCYVLEYLIIQIVELCMLVDGIESVGLIFFGVWMFELVGDYCSGFNYVLFIYGYVCSYSGVLVVSFFKQISVQEVSVDGLCVIGLCMVMLVVVEQLEVYCCVVLMWLDVLEGCV